MLKRTITAMALAGAMTLGAQAAHAVTLGLGGNFSVDEACGTAGAGSPCSETGGLVTNIDALGISYVSRVFQESDGVIDGNDAFREVGHFTINSFRDDSGNTIKNLNNDYKLYGTFEGVGTASLVPSGLGPIITADFTSFQFQIFSDDLNDTTLAFDAVSENLDIAALGAGDRADDQLVATATLLVADETILLTGLASGTFEVVLSDFGLSLFGEDVFVDPDPFYELINITPGVTALTEILGTTIGDGSQPFFLQIQGAGDAFFPVPEPGTLGIFGVGLLGLGLAAARRRRRETAAA